MEHLFLELEDNVIARESVEAVNANVFRDDGVGHKESLVAPISPFTQWLGFDHDGHADQSYPVQTDLTLYPAVRGWDLKTMWDKGDLRRGHSALHDETDCTSVGRQVATMLQSWLYFGLLESCLGKKVRTSYLVRYDDAGNPYLHSGNLGFALMAWKFAGLKATAAELQEILDNSLRNLNVVVSAVQRLLVWTDSGTEMGKWTRKHFLGYCELITHITPAIVRLFDAISTTRDQLKSTHGNRIVVINDLADSRAERNVRLRERGWCPFLIRYCQNCLHDSVLDWVDGSQKVNLSGGHDMCTRQECMRNNVDIKTYKTQHSDSCDGSDGCYFIVPDMEKMLSVIDENKIPVVIVQGGEGSDIEIIAQDPEAEGKYAAISHVWVDGLGSTAEKGLPKCQIKRLAKLVQDSTGSVDMPFWIDSLCIPSAPKQRGIAISFMRTIYQQAATVLVVDKTIRQCSSDSPVEDILWAITSSPWMQRLWTFQESFLAQELLFEMADNAFLSHDQDFPPSQVFTPLQVVHTAFTQHLHSIRPDKGLAERAIRTNLGEVATALTWRSTSRMSDEVLAIAAIFNLDTAKLARIHPKERMKAFYLMVRNVPLEIIFFDGGKLLTPSFRWAPETLMSRSEIHLNPRSEGQAATVTSDGLCGKYQVLYLAQDHEGGHCTRLLVCETTEDSIHSISWEETYQNPPRATFNAVIIREIEDGIFLKPDIGYVVEGIAIWIKSKTLQNHVCDYTGRVTILKYDARDSTAPSQAEILALSKARWENMELCIT